MLRPPLRFVALGDSYTIGTSVAPPERWPDQLVERLAASAPGADARLATPALDARVQPLLSLVANLAVNGSTTADVEREQLPCLSSLEPGFVSLLAGVNDVVQGVSLSAYERTVATILEALLAHVSRDRLLTISTPDYTVTPRGADYGDPTLRSTDIKAFNVAMANASATRSIAYVDIHDLSLRAAGDRSLIAGDGLHPSGAQYRLWVERIAPQVERLLATQDERPA